MAASDALKRPRFITLLAVLQLIGATIWLLFAVRIAVAIIEGSAVIKGSTESDVPIFLVAALLFGVLGVTKLLCGVGLLRLKPYGLTLQLVFAGIGLILIPIGTIISILIFVYLDKPGIKTLFSGKQASEFSADELGQIAAVPKGPGLGYVIALLSVINPAIIVPGLLRARMSGGEASPIGSLRAINSGESTYAESCANGGYAIDLADLVKPPSGSSAGFVSPDLDHNGVIKSGYRVVLSKGAATGVTDIGAPAATCNASTHTPASSYFASSEPVTPGSSGTRYFATDQRGIIFQSTSPIANPIVVSALVVPIQ